MKKMLPILVLSLVGSLPLLMLACGGDKPAQDPSSQSGTATATSATTPASASATDTTPAATTTTSAKP